MNAKECIIFLVLLFISFETAAAKDWISIDGSKAGKSFSVQTIESNDQFYKARIIVHGFYDTEISDNNEAFHEISFDFPSNCNKKGEPSLPVINQLFALPIENDLKPAIINEVWTEMTMGKIYPLQESQLENEINNDKFIIDKDIYKRDSYSPFVVNIGEIRIWKGIYCRGVSICPFVYHPTKNTLSVMKEFELRIDYTNAMSRHSASFLSESDKRLFANGNILTADMGQMSNIRNNNDYDYLIITGNCYNIADCQPLMKFCRWKEFKGLKTKVVTTTTAGNNASDIKQYITSEKNNRGIKYVLFVGDYDQIPLYVINDTALHYGLPIKSDYWYGCLDGNSDVLADIPIGRFPTNSVEELSYIVSKSIKYESTPISYYNKVLLVSGYGTSYVDCVNTIKNNYSNTSFTFTTLYGWYSGWNSGTGISTATNSDVINSINSHYNIVNYRGHGVKYAWGESDDYGWNTSNEYFYGTNVNMLSSDINSVFLNMCCFTGDIEYSQCMMKYFLFANNGAAAFVGSTNVSLTDANNIFNQLFYNHLLNNDRNRIGDCILYSHVQNINSLGTNALINAYMYIIGGDPSLEIWTDCPQSFGDIAINANNNTIGVTTTDTQNYDVCIVSEDGNNIDEQTVNGSNFTISVPTSNTYLFLSKNGYALYILYLNVTDNYIQNVTFNENYALYLKNMQINAGHSVTSSKPYGAVIVKDGSKLILKKDYDVILDEGFECQKGGELEIK